MRILILLLAVACGRQEAPAHKWLADPPADHPPGSRIAGAVSICFEHETTDGGWERIGVKSADGGSAVTYSAIVGDWYFPMDAGQLRLRPCDR